MTAEQLPPEGSDVPVEHSQAPAPASPGALIRAAREARQMSLETLADQTKLARNTLEALETDDFGALLEPVYVRGYYRKCAKVLDVPEDQLLAAYASRVTPSAPRMPAKIRLSPSKGDGAGWLARLVSIVLLIGVIGVAVFLWMERGRTIEAGVPSAPETAVAVNPLRSVTPSPTPADAAIVAPTAADDVAVSDDNAAVVAQPVPTPTSSPSRDATSDEVQLTLRFTETSWVRVNDGAGAALINGLMNPGQDQQLRGTPPLSVFLGNAPGVELLANGTAIDLAPFTQTNNTARLQLPLSAD